MLKSFFIGGFIHCYCILYVGKKTNLVFSDKLMKKCYFDPTWQNDSLRAKGALKLYKCLRKHQFSLSISFLITSQLPLFQMMAYWPKGQVSQLVSENKLLIFSHCRPANISCSPKFDQGEITKKKRRKRGF